MVYNMRVKKKRINVTLDADAARILTAYAKRHRFPLGRLLQDCALSVLLMEQAPEIPPEARHAWAERLVTGGTPAGCRHNNRFLHLELDLGGVEKEFHLGEKFEHINDALVWYVSVRAGGRFGQGLLRTLHYVLEQHEWVDGDVHSEANGDRLVKLALPLLQRDLMSLKAGKQLSALHNPALV